MPETQHEDMVEGRQRDYEFIYKTKNSRGLPIMPCPILVVTEEDHKIKFTGNDLAKMLSLFLKNLNL